MITRQELPRPYTIATSQPLPICHLDLVKEDGFVKERGHASRGYKDARGWGVTSTTVTCMHLIEKPHGPNLKCCFMSGLLLKTRVKKAPKKAP